MHKLKQRFTFLVLVLLSSIALAKETIEYPQISGNPAYSAVTELGHRAHDQKIAYGDDPNQYGLLWHHHMFSKHGTLVVFIHGGCWLSAYDIQHTLPAATAIAQAGFPVWSLEYRRTGESGGGWPTTYEDIKAGIKAITKLQPHGISPKRVIVAGHSAGGHLALLAARDAEQLFNEDVDTHFIGLAAITDIETYAQGDNGCQKAGAQFMQQALEQAADAYDQANPIKYTINQPMVLMHGTADPIVPLKQTSTFQGTMVDKETVPEAGHFDWVHPGTPAFNLFIHRLRTIAYQ